MHLPIFIFVCLDQFPASRNNILKCKCDVCQLNNYTCTTNGGCLTILKRNEAGKVTRRRSCGYDRPLHRMTCEPNANNDHLLIYHCCYYNMCNINVNVTLPTIRPAVSLNDGKYW
jgi:hypothetical protein